MHCPSLSFSITPQTDIFGSYSGLGALRVKIEASVLLDASLPNLEQKAAELDVRVLIDAGPAESDFSACRMRTTRKHEVRKHGCYITGVEGSRLRRTMGAAGHGPERDRIRASGNGM